MGAKAQDRQTHQSPTDHDDPDLSLAKYDADAERRVFNAGVGLLNAMNEYQAVAKAYQQGGGWLELDEEIGHLAWAGPSFEQELLQLRRAIEVIEVDIP